MGVGGRVPNLYPRFSFQPQDSNTSTTVQFDGTASFVKAGTISSYTWNFGDESTATVASPTHTFSSAGTYTVKLTLVDSSGNTSLVKKEVRIQPANNRPFIFSNQSFTLEKNKSLSLNLLSGTDWEKSALSYSVVRSPTQGTLSACLGGTSDLLCTYQPPMNFTGEVEFSYKANDGTSDSNPVVVKINVIDPVPSVVQISSSWGHSCALFDNKKIKCWGYNDYVVSWVMGIQTILEMMSWPQIKGLWMWGAMFYKWQWEEGILALF